MMDNFERREIERMYRDGYGPTAISYELEISINTIKSYIRRHPSITSILISKVKPVVSCWKKPITIARHAYGDIYKAVEYRKGGNPIGKGRPQA